MNAFPQFEASKYVEFKPQPLAGNGVFVKPEGTLQKTDLVFSIPLEMCIGHVSPLTREMRANKAIQSNASIELALALLLELGNTKFAPYIAVLPTRFDTMPITWSTKELTLIQDLNVSVVIGHRITDICLAYCHFFECGFVKNLTLEDFFWAMCIVFSRQNPLPGGKLVLVPAFDMCNHDPELTEITTEITTENRLVCRAARKFAAGEEITIFYGPRPNDEFLSHAGFVVKRNKHSKVILPMVFDTTTPVQPVQHVLLRGVPAATKCADNVYLITVGWDDVSGLIAFARANCAVNKELAAPALKRKLEQGNQELTSTEKQTLEAMISKQIALLGKSPAAATEECREAVVRVVAELRESIVELLEHSLELL